MVQRHYSVRHTYTRTTKRITVHWSKLSIKHSRPQSTDSESILTCFLFPFSCQPGERFRGIPKEEKLKFQSIPEDMKLPYALLKTEEYINRDLESMFNTVVQRNGGEVPALAAGVRERCYELDRCRGMVDVGTVRRKLRDGGYERV